MANNTNNIITQILSQATDAEILGELKKRGINIANQEKPLNRPKNGPNGAFIDFIRVLLILFILLGFALMGYLAYISFRIG